MCSAQPGEPCLTISGRLTYQSHLARYLPAGSFRERHLYKPYKSAGRVPAEERVTQLIHLIRVLHKPVNSQWSLTCHGCDLGPHPEDYPDWPCSTAGFVFTREEIAQAEEAAGLRRQIREAGG